jgi:hypothetical protein
MSAGPSCGHRDFSMACEPRHPFSAIRTATSTLTKPSILERSLAEPSHGRHLAARPWRLNCSSAPVPQHVSRSPIGTVIAAAGAFVLVLHLLRSEHPSLAMNNKTRHPSKQTTMGEAAGATWDYKAVW